jgi:O-antigen/teichoic acid export membrane protein
LLLQFYGQWFIAAADRWTLKVTHHDAQLGSYALAFQVTNPISFPANAWNESEYARLGELSRTSGLAGLRAELPGARRIFFVLTLVPAICLVIALPLLPLVLGPRAAVPPALVLMLASAQILDAQIYPSQMALFYSSKTHLLNPFTVLSLIVNVATLSCLVPAYGGFGAAGARIATSAVRAGVLVVLTRHSLKER